MLEIRPQLLWLCWSLQNDSGCSPRTRSPRDGGCGRQVGQSLNNLGNLYRDQGKYGEAEDLLKRALAIREKALSPSHPFVAGFLTNLANVFRDPGKYGEAEELYKRALVIREQALGASHPEVAWDLNNMALLYEARGESGSALAYSRKATAAVLAHRAVRFLVIFIC
jgi:tetratricopeptide (TPR) repeat protein